MLIVQNRALKKKAFRHLVRVASHHVDLLQFGT